MRSLREAIRKHLDPLLESSLLMPITVPASPKACPEHWMMLSKSMDSSSNVSCREGSIDLKQKSLIELMQSIRMSLNEEVLYLRQTPWLLLNSLHAKDQSTLLDPTAASCQSLDCLGPNTLPVVRRMFLARDRDTSFIAVIESPPSRIQAEWQAG